VFGGLPGLAGLALARDDDGSDPEVVQVVLDAGLAVAAVSGDRARPPPRAGDHPRHGGGQLRRIRRIALVEGVVQDHSIDVVDDLGLVAELDRATQPLLGDRSGVGIVQAHPPGGAVGSDPGEALPGLCGDLARNCQQLGEVIDRTLQPAPPLVGQPPGV